MDDRLEKLVSFASSLRSVWRPLTSKRLLTFPSHLFVSTSVSHLRWPSTLPSIISAPHPSSSLDLHHSFDSPSSSQTRILSFHTIIASKQSIPAFPSLHPSAAIFRFHFRPHLQVSFKTSSPHAASTTFRRFPNDPSSFCQRKATDSRRSWPKSRSKRTSS